MLSKDEKQKKLKNTKTQKPKHKTQNTQSRNQNQNPKQKQNQGKERTSCERVVGYSKQTAITKKGFIHWFHFICFIPLCHYSMTDPLQIQSVHVGELSVLVNCLHSYKCIQVLDGDSSNGKLRGRIIFVRQHGPSTPEPDKWQICMVGFVYLIESRQYWILRDQLVHIDRNFDSSSILCHLKQLLHLDQDLSWLNRNTNLALRVSNMTNTNSISNSNSHINSNSHTNSKSRIFDNESRQLLIRAARPNASASSVYATLQCLQRAMCVRDVQQLLQDMGNNDHINTRLY